MVREPGWRLPRSAIACFTSLIRFSYCLFMSMLYHNMHIALSQDNMYSAKSRVLLIIWYLPADELL